MVLCMSTVHNIIQELLVVIRETENDELTSVMEELIETYSDQIEDVAVELCVSLVSHPAFMGGL